MTTYLMMLAFALLAANAVLAWAFVGFYSRVRWNATREGRHLMRFTLILALMFTMTLAFNVVRVPFLVRAVISLALFAGSAYELGNRLRLERRAQRERAAAQQ
jgi:hypothetical protein